MNRLLMSVAVAALTVGVAAAGPKGNTGGGQSGGKPSGQAPHNSGTKSHGGTQTHNSGTKSHGGTQTHNSGHQWGQSKTSYHDSSYFKTYSKSFGSGYCYPGQSQSHWTYSCYSPRFGCECFWCPYTTCYYYYSAPACCYYPVSCLAPAPIAVAPPVQVQVQTQVQTQTQSQSQFQGPPSVSAARPAGVPLPPQ